MSERMDCAVCKTALNINQGAFCSYGCEQIAANERDTLRTLLEGGIAYVRDANQLLAADGNLDEDDEDGVNEWLEKAVTALAQEPA